MKRYNFLVYAVLGQNINFISKHGLAKAKSNFHVALRGSSPLSSAFSLKFDDILTKLSFCQEFSHLVIKLSSVGNTVSELKFSFLILNDAC